MMTRVLLFLLVVGSLGSCVSKKKMVYLQRAEDAPPIDSVLFNYTREAYRLQVNDIVDVTVSSPEKIANEFFNIERSVGNAAMQVGAQSGGDLYYLTGYTINDSGFLRLPVVGNVLATGKTIEELKDAIDVELKKYLKEYYLEVKLGGIRFSVLGEFHRPGKFVILQNQATIFEAMAQAGDLNMVASRSDIRLIRQYPDGTRVHTLNLLDDSIIGTPYYFIQPNDVIYAEPLKAKSWGIGVTGAQTLTTVLSAVSTSLALILAVAAFSNN